MEHNKTDQLSLVNKGSKELAASDNKRQYLQRQNRTLPSYREYKHRREQEKARREQRDALNKFNTKFSNTCIPESKKNIEEPPTVPQPVVFMGSSTDKMSMQYSRAGASVYEVDKEIHSIRMTPLKRSPIICPITQCSNTIGASSALTHLLQDHRNDNLRLQEIYTGIRSAIAFSVKDIARDNNCCLGILAFAGKTKEGPYPGDRDVCFRNTFLPKGAEHFESHLPVMVMAHRTSFVQLLAEKASARDADRVLDPHNEVILIWCASPQTTTPIHCTLTACNKELTFSRSTIALVRSVLDIQNPRTFVNTTPHYLLLCHGEIQKLTNGGTTAMRLEILVTEY